MAGFFKKTFGRLFDWFKNMKKGQKVRLIILLCVIVIVIVTASALLNQTQYTVLYSGMDPKDAGEVLSVLQEMNVDAKPQGPDTILVNSEQADTIRMQLAAQGYPNSGYNFDIFKNASGLGTTDMEKQFYLQMQLQANIRQTILKLDKVEDAAVSINLSKESPFVLSDNNKPATAAVMLKLKNGKTISKPEVRAIGELVSKSVSGLKLEDVRIIDSNMKLYTIENDETAENIGTQLELSQSVQERLQKQVINLLSPVFGEGRVLAEVNVTLDFDTQKTESTIFTQPENRENGLAVSMKELAEVVKNSTSGAVSGTDANGAASQYLSATDPDALYSKLERETNYEINETKTQVEKAKGQIKDLSVSVILDSTDMADDYKDNVVKLVATAIGVSQERITVDMLPFKKIETTEIAEALDTQKQLMDTAQSGSTTRIIIIAIAAFAVLLLLFFIVKTLKKGKAEYSDKQEPAGSVDVMADEPVMPEPAHLDIDFDAKEDTSLSKLERYIDKSPESVAQLLRNWLSDEYGR